MTPSDNRNGAARVLRQLAFRLLHRAMQIVPAIFADQVDQRFDLFRAPGPSLWCCSACSWCSRCAERKGGASARVWRRPSSERPAAPYSWSAPKIHGPRRATPGCGRSWRRTRRRPGRLRYCPAGRRESCPVRGSSGPRAAARSRWCRRRSRRSESARHDRACSRSSAPPRPAPAGTPPIRIRRVERPPSGALRRSDCPRPCRRPRSAPAVPLPRSVWTRRIGPRPFPADP